jgi:competence protein ComEA
VVVHVAGAVAMPGVHRLAAGSRVADAVAAAGGSAADADTDRLNLAAPLGDGSRVYVPRRGEAGAPPTVVPDDAATPGTTSGATTTGGTGSGPAPSAAGPINVNTAGPDELDRLPGIGPATAAAIIDHRTRHGPFGTVDDLAKVRGIGPAKLAQLRGLVAV